MENLIISKKDTSKFDEVAFTIAVVEGKLIHATTPEQSMIELIELVQAAGSEVKGHIIVHHDIDEDYYMHKDTLEYLARQAKELNVNMLVAIDELTGKQLKNIEELTGLKIVDRTMLLLDIWANRSTRREGRIEVEKAQLTYRSTRLEGFQGIYKYGTGIGVNSPTGNRLLTDPDSIKTRLETLNTDLAVIVKNRFVQRSKKFNDKLPLVALAGYTNSGKSTLMNKLLQLSPYHKPECDVVVKDKMLSTVDVTMKKRKLPNGTEFILVDTIGFVSDLPGILRASFRSTIEEVSYADLILNVFDSSSEELDIQKEVMEYTFERIGAQNNPKINVYNKADNLKEIPESDDNNVYVSAKSGLNMKKLIEVIEKHLSKKIYDVTLLIPFGRYEVFNEIKETKVLEMEDFRLTKNGVELNIVLDTPEYDKYREFIKK